MLDVIIYEMKTMTALKFALCPRGFNMPDNTLISILCALLAAAILLAACSPTGQQDIATGEGSDSLPPGYPAATVPGGSGLVAAEDRQGEATFPGETASAGYLPLVKNAGNGNQPQDPAGDCFATERHKVGESIAATFEVPYEQVITWFCQGSEFADILLALQTSEETGLPVEELLEKRAGGQSWDEIWKEIGLVD